MYYSLHTVGKILSKSDITIKKEISQGNYGFISVYYAGVKTEAISLECLIDYVMQTEPNMIIPLAIKGAELYFDDLLANLHLDI